MFRVIVAAVVCAATTTTARGDDAIMRQANHMFEPPYLAIKRGTSVHFTNAENVIHHVYAESGGMQFDSGDIPPSGDFVVRFDTPGHFVVRCAIHPMMRAEIDVAD